MEQTTLDQVVSKVKVSGLSDELVSGLRQEFNDLHFTYCMDDDMDAHKPAIEEQGFNVYFVDSSQHCSKLTNYLENASGLVLAEVFED